MISFPWGKVDHPSPWYAQLADLVGVIPVFRRVERRERGTLEIVSAR